MTRAAKVVYGIAILCGLIAGAMLGFEQTSDLLEYYDSITSGFAPDALADYAYFQYRYADAEHARSALQNYADFLEKSEKIHSDLLQRRELSIADARLALVEEAANNPERSGILMEKARYWYAAGSPDQEPSDSDMKKAVKLFDENNVR